MTSDLVINDLVSVLFDRWRSLAPNDQTLGAPAFTWWPVDTQGHQDLSYAELKREILRGAQVIDKLGLGRGDVIGLQVSRSPRWLPLFLGALSHGVVVLLLNDAYTPRELNFAISDAEARIALVPRGKLDELARLQAQREGETPAVLIDAGELSRLFEETHSAEFLASDRPSFSGDALAVLAYTSGTTGQPKGARIRHRDLIGTLEALHEAWAWSPEDRLIHTLPLFHIHGLFVAALGALWARAHIIALDRFDALGALRAVEHHRATVLMGVPTHHHRYLQLPASDRPDVSSLRLVTSGSAPLSAERFEAFREAFGVEIVERYGMTEVGIVLSERLDRARRPGSVGFPLPGVSAKICDPEGAELGVDEVGEVHISSRSLFEGYHQLPEATAASVYERDGARWMRTGDIGMRDEDGRYWLRGRASEMIISGGLNVYPREVERALLEVASTHAPEVSSEVSEVLALGVPDPEWGERVEAYLTTRGR